MPYKITITEFHKSLLNTLFKWSNTIEIRFNNIKTRERITTNIMNFSSPAKYCIRKNPKENPKSKFIISLVILLLLYQINLLFPLW